MAIPELAEFLTCGSIYALDHNRFSVGWGSGRQTPASGISFFHPQFFPALDDNESAPENQAVIDRTSLEQALRSYLQSDSPAPALMWQATHDAFVEQFVALKELLSRGSLSKGVPYGQLQTSTAVDPTWIARRLQQALQNGTAAHLYGYWNRDEGLIGCSPERLCEYAAESKVLSTEAVAGTIPQEGYEPGALLDDHKAVQEHSLVVEDLTERLSDLGTVEVGRTCEYQVPGLVHLQAPLRVHVQRQEISMAEVVDRLHPTAALGVYPRNQAGRAWLRDADRRLPRWRFGAPFGVSEQSETGASFSCLVAIRNVQWRGHDVRISAGCGVVESSQLEGEWQECLAKIQSIRNLLDL